MGEAVTAPVEHGIMVRALAGQDRSGDRGVYVEFAGGVLVAAIDGLGHGDEAATAAETAARVLSAEPGAALAELVTRCHTQLRATRGAAMSLAALDLVHASITWLGIGNVEGVLVRAVPDIGDEALVTAGGIVGYRLPAYHARTLVLHPGDTLVFATDGIKQGFRGEIMPVREPQVIADRIVGGWARTEDDACAVVARFCGNADDGTRVDVDGEAGVAQARIRARDQARALGFDTTDIEALATAVSELARNILDHAIRGEITFARVGDHRRRGLAVQAWDRGPGIANVARAIEDDFSTSGGLGCGLSGARRFVDDLHVQTELGAGTVITITKWVR